MMAIPNAGFLPLVLLPFQTALSMGVGQAHLPGHFLCPSFACVMQENNPAHLQRDQLSAVILFFVNSCPNKLG